MDAPFYDKNQEDSRGEPPDVSKKVTVETIDHTIYRWLIQRMHPLRWATYNPANSPSAEQLLNGLAGKTRAKNGANRFNAFWIAKCRQTWERLYLCSGFTRGFLWADLDAHLWWQKLTEAERAAIDIHEEFIRQGLWIRSIRYRSSYQGYHCVIPVRFDGVAAHEVCQVFDLFQDGMRRLLQSRGSAVATTSEVKGHPPSRREDGTMCWGEMCRLPIEQEWGVGLFNELMKTPETPIWMLRQVAENMRANYPPVLFPGKPQPNHLIPQSCQALSRSANYQTGGTINSCNFNAEPDSRKRQHEALMELSRRLKKVPSDAEALDYIHQNNLFTPPWHQNQAKRTQRVRAILMFIAKTFDPMKCSSGNWIESVSCRLNEARDYAQRHFTAAKMREAAAVFLAIAEYCLVVNPNRDGSVPRDGFESLWKQLFAKGLTWIRWNRHRWKIIRETFERMTVIIVGEDWGPGQAKRWELGPNWPF